jgi:hypothetical protein
VEDVDLGVCKGRWYAGDADRVIVILPGARYLPFAPLLWFAREVGLSRGWSVLRARARGRDHGLQLPGDPLASVEALRRVVERMNALVGGA